MLNRRLLLASLAVSTVAPSALAEDNALEALRAQNGAPALAGAAFDDKTTLALEVAGLRKVSGSDPATTADQWHIGSNTKAMTAALYGRLVDQGRARWGAMLSDLFPDLGLDPGFAKVTIEQLLGHRAGLLDAPVLQGPYMLKALQDKRPLVEQRAELAGRLLTVAPAGTVGDFAYSNIGYILAGAAIERITGQSWEEAISAQLFEPLGIATAGFGAPTGANPWGHRGAAGGLSPVDPTGFADNPAVMGPAGRVHIALSDYGRFLRLFLTRGGKLLKPATVERLTTPVAGDGRAYALGWGVSTPPWGGGPVLGHEGSNTMWHAVAFVAPARRMAFVGAVNAPPPATKQVARTEAERLRTRFIPG